MYVLIFVPKEPLQIYNPFASVEFASEFGNNWQKENDDLLFWQVIEKPIIEFHHVP